MVPKSAVNLFISILASFSVIQVQADVDWASFVWHNDLPTGKDGGGYTNGVFISIYDLSYEGGEEFKSPLLTRPFAFVMPKQVDYEYKAHSFGHSMVTPLDIEEPLPDVNSAPYAGLLTLASSHLTVNGNIVDRITTTAGVVGPSSRAEEAQTWVHEVVNAREPRGWDSQIEDRALFNVSRARLFRTPVLGLASVDSLSSFELNLGNIETSAGFTQIFRFGRNLDEGFSTALLESDRAKNPVAINEGWYIYFGFSAEFFEHHAIVNFNDRRPNNESTLAPQQYSALGGVSHAWSSVSLSLSFRNGNPLDELASARSKFGAMTSAVKF